MKLFTVLFSSPSLFFLPFMSKYSPQHPLLKHLNLRSFLNVKDKVPCPYVAKGKINLYVFK